MNKPYVKISKKHCSCPLIVKHLERVSAIKILLSVKETNYARLK